MTLCYATSLIAGAGASASASASASAALYSATVAVTALISVLASTPERRCDALEALKILLRSPQDPCSPLHRHTN